MYMFLISLSSTTFGRAISIFNVNLGKKGKEQPTWELIKVYIYVYFSHYS